MYDFYRKGPIQFSKFASVFFSSNCLGILNQQKTTYNCNMIWKIQIYSKNWKYCQVFIEEINWFWHFRSIVFGIYEEIQKRITLSFSAKTSRPLGTYSRPLRLVSFPSKFTIFRRNWVLSNHCKRICHPFERFPIVVISFLCSLLWY